MVIDFDKLVFEKKGVKVIAIEFLTLILTFNQFDRVYGEGY